VISRSGVVISITNCYIRLTYLLTLRFWAPSGWLRVNVRCLSWAHWQARNGLPISVNWTFFARCGENRSKIGVLKAGGSVNSVCAKFSRRRGRPHQLFLHG